MQKGRERERERRERRDRERKGWVPRLYFTFSQRIFDEFRGFTSCTNPI